MVRPKIINIKETCIKLGFELLDEKYKNNSFKHTYRCIKHNQVHKACYKILRLGIGLRCCRLERLKNLNDFRKHGIDDVKKFSLECGFEFLDNSYEGINHKHFFKCLRHEKISKASYKHIKRGFGLKCCHLPDSCEVKKEKNEYALKKLDTLGLKLVGDFKTKCFVKCKKHGMISFVSINSIIKNKHQLACCSNETKPHASKNSFGWKKISILETKCYVCNQKSNLESIPDYINTENAGTCHNCRIEFHNLFGFNGNTKEQFEEFVLLYGKDPGGSNISMRKIDWSKR